MTTLSDFMARVVPWPAPNSVGYVNLHWRARVPSNQSQEYWSGKPTQSVKSFEDLVQWAQMRKDITDIYYCLSLQSTLGRSRNGKTKVIRFQENAMSLRAIWLDVDIKDPPKGYATLDEALLAISDFIAKVGLPAPTALVGSGGGLHVYWCSDIVLTPEQWRPYAEGLKTAAIQFGLRCDAGVTTDSARVLRVPGTLNYKTTPPKPVKLLGLRPTDYTFTKDLAMLAALAPTITATVKSNPGFDLSNFPKRPIPPEGIESLAEGLEREELPPLEAHQIFKNCAFMRTALETGGKDYSQPMWNLTTLAATWIENGHALAHKLGKSHPGYTADSTDRLWDRKTKERRDRNLGWPSCAAIQAAGSAACASCPHLAKRKSPLNLAGGQLIPASILATGVPTSIQADNLNLPKGYDVDQNGIICQIEEEPVKGGPPITKLVPLFHCQLSRPWTQKGPDSLNFTTTTDKGNFRPVSIPPELMATSAEVVRVMLKQNCKPMVAHAQKVQVFTLSWYSKLQAAQAATTSLPFGWLVEDGGKRKGFVYGGMILRDDGSEQPAGYGDAVIRKQYSPTGALDPWMTAFKLIVDQKRPELDAIVASAFAAPLMICPGEYNVLLSAWGHTGAGKSTAMKVALSVWGHPKLAKEITLSTSRSVVKKMGELRNLPLYWDEIKDDKAQLNVFNSIFGPEGVGPGRLSSNADMKDKTDWQTMMVICANVSFLDHVAKMLKSSAGGMYRVLEYYIAKAAPNAPGQTQSYTAARITQKLEHNYGIMGMKYAKMLAMAPDAIDEFVMGVVDQFAKDAQTTREERNWTVAGGTLLAGAALCNELCKGTGLALDIDGIRKLMISAIKEGRVRIVDDNIDGGSVDNTESVLTQFLKEFVDQTIYTDTFPMGPGKPKAVSVLNVLQMNNNRPKAIQVQWAVKEQLLRISRSKFVDWMNEKTISPNQTMEGLKIFFKMTSVKARLAANTNWQQGQERLIHIPVPAGTWMEEQMYAHGGAPDGWGPGHKQIAPLPEVTAVVTMPAGDATGALAAGVAQAQKDLNLVRQQTGE